MMRNEDICAYLISNHRGKERAVSSSELERLFSINGRSLRRVISGLRQSGCPICSGCMGYYYAQNQDEINDTVSHLNELVTGLSNARTGLLYSKISAEEPEQKAVEIVIRITGGDAEVVVGRGAQG